MLQGRQSDVIKILFLFNYMEIDIHIEGLVTERDGRHTETLPSTVHFLNTHSSKELGPAEAESQEPHLVSHVGGKNQAFELSSFFWVH